MSGTVTPQPPTSISYTPYSLQESQPATPSSANSSRRKTGTSQVKPPAKANTTFTGIFVPFGTNDPEKGKRRKDVQEDARRKEEISRAGGVCLGCKLIRKQCDGNEPCDRCAKNGLISEADIKRELQKTACSDGHHRSCSFATDPKDLFQWLRRFRLPLVKLTKRQFISLEISLPDENQPTSFQVSTHELAHCFQDSKQDLSGLGLTATALTTALLPRFKRSKILDMSKASLVTREILKIFLAIQNFVKSSVSVSIGEEDLASSLCAFSLIHMIILLNQKVCILEGELAIIDRMGQFCYRSWEQSRGSINLLKKIMHAIQSLPVEDELGPLLVPLKARADTFRRSLAHQSGRFEKNPKGEERPQSDENDLPEPPPENIDDFPVALPATIAVFQTDGDAAIPGKASRGFALYEETLISVIFLLKAGGSGSVSDYLGEVFRDAGRLPPPPSRHTTWQLNNTNEDFFRMAATEQSFQPFSPGTAFPSQSVGDEEDILPPLQGIYDPNPWDTNPDTFLNYNGGIQDLGAGLEMISEHWADEQMTQFDGATTIVADAPPPVVPPDPEPIFDNSQSWVLEPTDMGPPLVQDLDIFPSTASELTCCDQVDATEPQRRDSQAESHTSGESSMSHTKQVQFSKENDKAFEFHPLELQDVSKFKPADGQKKSPFTMDDKRNRSWTPSRSRSRKRVLTVERVQNMPIRSANIYEVLSAEEST